MTVPMVPTSINGRWTLLLPEHRAARPEWPWWEATRLAAMAHHIGPGDVVWDVGAEEGDFPALWSSWGAQVVLAEPNPLVWANIRAIFEANDLPAPAACLVGFFSDRTDLLENPEGWLRIGGEHPWPPCADGEVIGDHGFMQLGERPDVIQLTIDDLAQIHADKIPPPTVITMDVEGSELQVLMGGAGTIVKHRPKVFVSIHPEFMQHHYGIVDGVQAVRGWFAQARYDEQFLSIDHEHHWLFTPR
jgi:FkbM family methyltransferase